MNFECNKVFISNISHIMPVHSQDSPHIFQNNGSRQTIKKREPIYAIIGRFFLRHTSKRHID